MTDFSKEQLISVENYLTARIEHEQPDPDVRLFCELGHVAYELNQLEEKD